MWLQSRKINPGDKNIQLLILKKLHLGLHQQLEIWLIICIKKLLKLAHIKLLVLRVAEAAKVIENTQRDLNIALINELSIIFNKMNIETKEVLDAAASKWNFLPFQPGLVGGHCIGVDPYYLTFKSKNIGYNPKIILAGRKLNDNMGNYVANN